MPRSEVNALTLLAVLIAASLAPTIAPERSVFAQPLLGAVLLVILFSYDREGRRDMGQSLGFAAVAAYCATRVLLPLLAAFVLSGQDAIPWFSIIWAIATLILWAIDISRMGSRAAAQTHPAAPAVLQTPTLTRGSIPERVAEAPHRETPLRETPVRVQPVVAEPFVPPAAPVRPPSATSLFSQPITPPRPVEEMPTAPISVPPPNAVPVSTGAGKPATIYLNLVGEGLACLRSVQAEHLGKDFYLIVEPVPQGESWQFQPGQVVRCQKRNLSSGKALVAVEEAPRAS